MRALLRILVIIPAAYTIASLAAGYLIYAAWQSSGRIAPIGSSVDIFELALGGFFMSMMFATTALPVSTVAIIISEMMRLRGFVSYVLVGLAHGLVLAWAAADEFHFVPFSDHFYNQLPEGAEAYLAGGAIWGLAYWVLAGRIAGYGFGNKD